MPIVFAGHRSVKKGINLVQVSYYKVDVFLGISDGIFQFDIVKVNSVDLDQMLHSSNTVCLCPKM